MPPTPKLRAARRARAAKRFYLDHPHAKPKPTPRGEGWPQVTATGAPIIPLAPKRLRRGFHRSRYPRVFRYPAEKKPEPPTAPKD